jgi:hypothetical protein
METTREHIPMADRYRFDWGECSSSKGFAQIDTDQDASYFGTWANPTSLKIVSFTEGDLCVQEAETEAEFVSAMVEMKHWYEENGHRFLGIDPMCSHSIERAFRGLGLGGLLH